MAKSGKKSKGKKGKKVSIPKTYAELVEFFRKWELECVPGKYSRLLAQLQADKEGDSDAEEDETLTYTFKYGDDPLIAPEEEDGEAGFLFDHNPFGFSYVMNELSCMAEAMDLIQRHQVYHSNPVRGVVTFNRKKILGVKQILEAVNAGVDALETRGAVKHNSAKWNSFILGKISDLKSIFRFNKMVISENWSSKSLITWISCMISRENEKEKTFNKLALIFLAMFNTLSLGAMTGCSPEVVHAPKIGSVTLTSGTVLPLPLAINPADLPGDADEDSLGARIKEYLKDFLTGVDHITYKIRGDPETYGSRQKKEDIVRINAPTFWEIHGEGDDEIDAYLDLHGVAERALAGTEDDPALTDNDIVLFGQFYFGLYQAAFITDAAKNTKGDATFSAKWSKIHGGIITHAPAFTESTFEAAPSQTIGESRAAALANAEDDWSDDE